MPGARRWGWHRLQDSWAERVVEQVAVGAGDLVLDLGAGTGALVGPLLDVGAEVLAVEIHRRRAEHLRRRYGDRVRVLEVDLADLRLPHRPFRVVANPPHALSVSLVRSLLGSDRLRSADLVLPRGVTRRIVDQPPRARHARRYRVEGGLLVPRRAFDPAPPGDARVLTVRR